MDVVELASRTDYRMEKLAGSETFHVPADAAAEAALTKAFETLTGRPTGKPATLKMQGREIAIPQSRGNVARFAFPDLCGKPLGAQDYLAIAKRYHSVLIDRIPKVDAAQRTEVQRFVRLIRRLLRGARQAVRLRRRRAGRAVRRCRHARCLRAGAHGVPGSSRCARRPYLSACRTAARCGAPAKPESSMRDTPPVKFSPQERTQRETMSRRRHSADTSMSRVSSCPMRWTVLNGLGAAAWLAGLTYAKGIGGLSDPYAANDHHLLVGACIGAMGLVVLVWANLRSAS